MSNTTVAQFAAELNRPVDDLLKQLKEAGVNKNSGNDSITTDDKQLLTAYLQKKNGSNSGTISIRRKKTEVSTCLLYTSPSPRDVEESRMPSSA